MEDKQCAKHKGFCANSNAILGNAFRIKRELDDFKDNITNLFCIRFVIKFCVLEMFSIRKMR